MCAATVATGSSLSTTTFETFFSLLLLDDSNSKSIPNLVFTKAEFCSFFKKKGQSSAFFYFLPRQMPKKNRRHLYAVLCVCVVVVVVVVSQLLPQRLLDDSNSTFYSKACFYKGRVLLFFLKKRGQSSAFFIFTKAKYHMPKKNRRHLNTVLCVCSSGSFSTVAPKTRCCLLFLFFEEAV